MSKLECFQRFVWAAGFGLSAMAGSAAADMVDKTGMAPWEVCAMCHGVDGISVMDKFPKLAGQKPGYLVRQFGDFRAGRRTNDGGQMAAISTEVTETDIEAIVAYFAQLAAPAPGTRDAINTASYALGENLYRRGRKNVPACAHCHEDPLADAPWLRGQHQNYLVKQLLDYQRGARTNDQNGAMGAIAKRLTVAEIRALAGYLDAAPQMGAKPSNGAAYSDF